MNMNYELVELVVLLLWDWMVAYSNLGRHELSYLFLLTSVGMEMER